MIIRYILAGTRPVDRNIEIYFDHDDQTDRVCIKTIDTSMHVYGHPDHLPGDNPLIQNLQGRTKETARKHWRRHIANGFVVKG